jgi:hypothetical protein
VLIQTGACWIVRLGHFFGRSNGRRGRDGIFQQGCATW